MTITTRCEERNPARECACAARSPLYVSRASDQRHAFTLIEIMVAIGIVAVILTISFPFMANQMRKDSMRQAVLDITEACRVARERAVLNGVTTEVRIQPRNGIISAVEGSGSGQPSFGAAAFDERGEPTVQHRGGGGTIFTVNLPKSVLIEFVGVNLIPDLHELDEVSASFYPNGTSDELVVLFRSDRGEVRKLTTDVITGIPDVEIIR